MYYIFHQYVLRLVYYEFLTTEIFTYFCYFEEFYKYVILKLLKKTVTNYISIFCYGLIIIQITYEKSCNI